MKKTISIALALLLMFSSIGLAKSTHICMGSESMHDFGLAVKHLNCGMESELVQQPTGHSGNKVSADDCCENQFELFQNDAEQQLKSQTISSPQLIFLASFAHAFVFGSANFPAHFSDFPYFSPPQIPQDFTILYESFLI